MSTRRKLALAAKAADALRQVGPRQAASLAGVVSTVVVIRVRKKLGLPRPVSSVCAFAAAPALAAGLERSRLRDGLMWGAQMWSYKTAFEIPNDAKLPERDRGRPRGCSPHRRWRSPKNP